MKEIQGWMGDNELVILGQWARTVNLIAEVGSWKGRSTRAFLENCPGKVIAVDHFQGSQFEPELLKEAAQDDIYRQFHDNVGHYKNLSVLRMNSLEAARLFKPDSVEMVFIDAGHSYEECLADIQAWGPICSIFLCGHDSDPVKDSLIASGIKYDTVENTGLWYRV